MKLIRLPLAIGLILAHFLSALPTRAQTPQPDGPDVYPQDVTGADLCPTISLSRTYGSGSQTVALFAPTPLPSSPAPLVVALHGSSAFGDSICEFLAGEAAARGWLIVEPQASSKPFDPNPPFLPTGRYNYGYVGAQHDVIDAINYMRQTYTQVNLNRIYVIGNSMGGQITALMLAKYPDVFAAGATYSALTDLARWHGELLGMPRLENLYACPSGSTPAFGPYCLHEYIVNEVGGTPAQVLFEYERRSPLLMAVNLRLTPLKMWHHQLDTLVTITHTTDLQAAVNATVPPFPVVVQTVTDNSQFPCDVGYRHCWQPSPAVLFDFVQAYSRNSQPPAQIQIRTDESKAYYWLNLVQTGSPHWSQVTATHQANQTVNLALTDTQTLTLGLNLGPSSIVGPAGLAQSGLGHTHAQYKVTVGNAPPVILPYASGYLTLTVSAGQGTLTLTPYYPVYLPLISASS